MGETDTERLREERERRRKMRGRVKEIKRGGRREPERERET